MYCMLLYVCLYSFFFFKQKTAYEMRISDWSSDVCSSDLVAAGADALVEAARRPVDLVMAAIVGCAGLAPTMAAIEAGRDVALANKEALVSAGDLMMAAARRSGSTILPVDSEHNAIFQCLAGAPLDQVRRITLTASGGPFRTLGAEAMAHVTPAQ